MRSSVPTAMYMSEILAWIIITQEVMVTKVKNQMNDTKLTSSEVASVTGTDAYSRLINESFLITSSFKVYRHNKHNVSIVTRVLKSFLDTSSFKVYIHNKDNVVSIVTRVFGHDSLSSVRSRSYKIFSNRSIFLAFYSLSIGGSFPMGRMPHVIG